MEKMQNCAECEFMRMYNYGNKIIIATTKTVLTI